MATNHPLLSEQFTNWVMSLSPLKPLLWCDECHHWHNTAADCPYSPPPAPRQTLRERMIAAGFVPERHRESLQEYIARRSSKAGA